MISKSDTEICSLDAECVQQQQAGHRKEGLTIPLLYQQPNALGTPATWFAHASLTWEHCKAYLRGSC